MSTQQRQVKQSSGGLSIGERVQSLAMEHPDKPVIVEIAPDGSATSWTWAQVNDRSDAVAWGMCKRAVGADAVVMIALPMGIDHVTATLAAWKTGATVLPVDPAATARELRTLVTSVQPQLVVAQPDVEGVSFLTGEELATPNGKFHIPAGVIPRSAHCTGGSTGRPRILLRPTPWVYHHDSLPSANDRAIGLGLRQNQLIMTPLFHGGFTKLYHGLALDHTAVLLPRFNARLVPRLIEEYRINYFVVVPTIMQKLVREPEMRTRDLTSVTTIHQGAAATPVQLKRAWMELFPPETVYEGYSSQERIGAVWIRGDEWLRHPGSVGRPVDCEVRIYDEMGRRRGPGEVGEVFIRAPFTAQPQYLGSGPPLPERDGFLSMGDAGYLDRDGYLYLAGRVSDVINVGGAKVYPAEIEKILMEHPAVIDCLVFAAPDATFGQVPHALVVTGPLDTVTSAELWRHCAAELSLYKVPVRYRIVDRIPRAETGKVPRSAITDISAGQLC